MLSHCLIPPAGAYDYDQVKADLFKEIYPDGANQLPSGSRPDGDYLLQLKVLRLKTQVDLLLGAIAFDEANLLEKKHQCDEKVSMQSRNNSIAQLLTGAVGACVGIPLTFPKIPPTGGNSIQIATGGTTALLMSLTLIDPKFAGSVPASRALAEVIKGTPTGTGGTEVTNFPDDSMYSQPIRNYLDSQLLPFGDKPVAFSNTVDTDVNSERAVCYVVRQLKYVFSEDDKDATQTGGLVDINSKIALLRKHWSKHYKEAYEDVVHEREERDSRRLADQSRDPNLLNPATRADEWGFRKAKISEDVINGRLVMLNQLRVLIAMYEFRIQEMLQILIDEPLSRQYITAAHEGPPLQARPKALHVQSPRRRLFGKRIM